jgi:hypothetical protein
VTATTDTAAGSSNRLAIGLAVGFGVVVLAILVLAPSNSGGADALDPASTSASGTKALMMLLEQSGASVRVTSQVPDAVDGTALLLSDTTTAADRAALQRWVAAGGVLVVTDHASGFVPLSRAPDLSIGPSVIPPGACDIATLDDLDSLRPSGSPARYVIPPGSSGCFADSTGAVVVDTPSGGGHVVAIGTPTVFTNDALDQGDDAGLAVNLLAPQPGRSVTVLWGLHGDGGGSHGRTSLWSLVSTGVKLATLQLLVAFVVYALWRGRRLGRVVTEPQPVELPGSELTRAHGRLLQQARDPDRAARLLRAELRRQLGLRLGVPPGASADVVVEVVSTRSGIERDRVARAVVDGPVRTDDELLDLAREIDALRTEVFHG